MSTIDHPGSAVPPRMTYFTDLNVVIVLAAVAAAASALPHELVALRLVLALPLVLLLPGYALARALLKLNEVRGTELFVVAMGLSIATTIFAALAMQALDIRLEETPWTIANAGVTVIAALVGTRLGHAATLRLPRAQVPHLREILALTAAVALIAGSAVLGFRPLNAPKGTQGQSPVWILPVHPATGFAEFGVINSETQTRRYTIQLLVAGKVRHTYGPIQLQPGGQWSASAVVGRGKPVTEVLLHYASAPKRTVNYGALRCWCVKVAAPSRR